MFSFDNNQLNANQVMEIAKQQGVSPLRVAINANGYSAARSFWDKVVEIDTNSEKYPVVSLGNDTDVVGKLSRSIADSIQFPASSAYMHFLGCMSAAMLGRFYVEYHNSKQPTGLYVVTSQPPSTGKSAINDCAIAPMVAEVDLMNENRKRERKKIMAKLSALGKEMKLEKSPSEMASLYEEKDELEEKLLKMCDITFPVSDTTPEGLARINFRQGDFAVISDEATAINSLLGLTYGDGSKKTNSELVLKAWDRNRVSIARANAENNMSFIASGAISVIAQDETINSIMLAGARGVGVSERFLLVREQTFLGSRTFCDDDGNSLFQPVDKSLIAQYHRLVHEVMNEVEVTLTVSNNAMKYLNKSRQQVENELGDGGKFSHTMLRGAIGKMDKQVIRIASVIHTIRNWFNENGSAPKFKEIEADTMAEAVAIYNELSKTYLSSANSAGFAGDGAEMYKLIEVGVSMAKKNKGVVGVRALYESCRKVKPFDGQAGVMKRMTDFIMPELEKRNYICVIGDKVFFNPNILA